MLNPSNNGSKDNRNEQRSNIGKILFTEKETYFENFNGAKIIGYVDSGKMEDVNIGDYLVIFHQDQDLKLYSIVEKKETFPIDTARFGHSFIGTTTKLQLKPFREVVIDENYNGRCRSHNIKGFELAFPNRAELDDIYNIPPDGLTLGHIEAGFSRTNFKYPLVPDHLRFQSWLISGVQGAGKGNLVKLFVQSLYSKTNDTIIILDREGEYSNFTKFEDLPNESQQFFKNNGIKTIQPKVFKLSSDLFEATATLSIKSIHARDILQLIPDVPVTSAHVLDSIASESVWRMKKFQIPFTLQNLFKEIHKELHLSQLLTGAAGAQVRGAIERALSPQSFHLFDQPGKIPLIPETLFKEKTINVIDCSTLSTDQQRMAALDLLLMINKYKFTENMREPGIHFIIDEAEVLFPKVLSGNEKYFVPRIAELASEPVKRGRKRKFGITLVTHLVGDVSPRIAQLCNNVATFKTAGSKTWIRDHFGKERVNEIETLPNFEFYLSTVKTGWPFVGKIKVPAVCHKNEVMEKIWA